MPISHKKKYIFIHIPKCAGTSIEKALSKTSQLELFRKKIDEDFIQRYSISKTGSLHGRERHLTALDVKNIVGPETYGAYYKFSFVRNPFSRLVSYYHFMRQLQHPDMNKLQVRLALEAASFKEFIFKALEFEEMKILFEQNDYIYDRALSCQVDFVGKVENIQHDIKIVMKGINRNSIFRRRNLRLEFTNKSAHKGYRSYFDEELISVVGDACATDLKLFDYQF